MMSSTMVLIFQRDFLVMFAGIILNNNGNGELNSLKISACRGFPQGYFISCMTSFPFHSENLASSSWLLCLIHRAREWHDLGSYCLGKHSEEDERKHQDTVKALWFRSQRRTFSEGKPSFLQIPSYSTGIYKICKYLLISSLISLGVFHHLYHLLTNVLASLTSNICIQNLNTLWQPVNTLPSA